MTLGDVDHHGQDGRGCGPQHVSWEANKFRQLKTSEEILTLDMVVMVK